MADSQGPLESGGGLTRRAFIAGGISGLAVVASAGGIILSSRGSGPTVTAAAATAAPKLQFFEASEATLVTAMAERMFPAMDGSPGATDLHVVAYIDGQLSGGWGQGERQYRQGPFVLPKEAGYGWQYDMTPGAAYKAALPALASYVKQQYGKTYDQLSGTQQDAVLTALEKGAVSTFQPSLQMMSAKDFFSMFRENVVEGLFADPMYGGNLNMDGWRWVGFPGNPMAYNDPYGSYIGQWFITYDVEPKSLMS
ncbi:MAG: gluconate 2-dehydrogenase subunit 3 family protein [Candidatus Dormiibacterota bacterium]